MQEYTPQKIDRNYGVMLVRLRSCASCAKTMISVPRSNILADDQVFPTDFANDFNAQVKRAGWVKRSKHTTQTSDGWTDSICTECADIGMAKFTCSLCGNIRSTNEVQESIGEPPDYLCKVCYYSKPASEWCEKKKELWENHKYDFS